MKKKYRMKPLSCVVILSAEDGIRDITARENGQLNYISRYANGNNIKMLKIVCRAELAHPILIMKINQALDMVSQGMAGSTFRRNRWRKNKGKKWSYGFECYDQINNGSVKKMIKLGKDPAGHCDVGMMAEWKLDYMFYEIMNSIFTDEIINDILNQGLDIFDQCYEINSHAEIDNQALRLEIGRIKSKIKNLVELRTEGDITKEDYRIKRDKLNQQLEAIEMKLEEAKGTKAEAVEIPDTDAIRRAIKFIRKMPHPMNLIKVVPMEIDYLDSGLKKDGYGTRQHVEFSTNV